MKKILWTSWSIVATILNLPITLLVMVLTVIFCKIHKIEINHDIFAVVLHVDSFPNFLRTILIDDLAGIGVSSVVLIQHKLSQENKKWLLLHELGHVRQNIILTVYLFLPLYFLCKLFEKNYQDNFFEKDANKFAERNHKN